MKLILTRHGETIGKNNDIIFSGEKDILNNKGKIQTNDFAKKLKGIDLIISSPMERCLETSKVINSIHNVKVEYSDLIKDKNWGDFLGMDKKSINYSSLKGSFNSIKPPNGESLNDIKKRVNTFLKQIINEYHDKDITILVVSHGPIIKIMLSILLGISMKDAIQKINIDNCTVTEIIFKNAEHKICCINKIL